MKESTLSIVLFLAVSMGSAFCQNSYYGAPSSKKPAKEPNLQYVVVLEIAPGNDVECNYPITTMIMEMPVSKEYYNSVRKDQEVLTWFKTTDEMAMLGDFKKDMNLTSRWTVVVRSKKVVEKLVLKAQPTMGQDMPNSK